MLGFCSLFQEVCNKHPWTFPLFHLTDSFIRKNSQKLDRSCPNASSISKCQQTFPPAESPVTHILHQSLIKRLPIALKSAVIWQVKKVYVILSSLLQELTFFFQVYYPFAFISVVNCWLIHFDHFLIRAFINIYTYMYLLGSQPLALTYCKHF